MDGMISVSSRSKILREIVSNLLAHRDYSNGYVAKMVIEQKQLYTENANRAHSFGSLSLANFDPFPKNPPISKVFREIGLADELGSGMRNTYKYTLLYSGAEPQFVEGNVFRTTIPLSEAATATVGPIQFLPGAEAGAEVYEKIKLDTGRLNSLLEFCTVPRTRAELQDFCGIKTEKYFREKILNPMLTIGLIRRTIPDRPNSPNQKYMKI